MADEDERARLERIVAIACDHGGFALKEALKVALPDVKWLDLGTNSADSVDYPDFAGKLADAIKAGKAGRGILICGSGIGPRMRASSRRAMEATSSLPQLIMRSAVGPPKKARSRRPPGGTR